MVSTLKDFARKVVGSEVAASPQKPEVVAGPTCHEQITAEVLDIYIPKWRTLCPKHITFRGDDFMLVSLDSFLAQPIDLSFLESLDVSCNALTDAHALEGISDKLMLSGCVQGANRFQALRILKARKNCISTFNALLPTLRELDLAHNQLTHMPSLAGLPKLEALILSHNMIHDTWELIADLLHLKCLDLSDNRFEFKPSRLAHELDYLACIPNLVTLRVHNNNFTLLLPEYQAVILWKLQSLKKLDNITEQEMPDARAMSQHIKGFKFFSTYDDKALSRAKTLKQCDTKQKGGKDESSLPVFSELVHAIEDALDDDPSSMYKEIKHLVRLTSKIYAAEPANVETIFRSPEGRGHKNAVEEAAKTEAAIQSFLDNFIIFFARVESNHGWRVMLMRSLAKLSIVATNNLGERCIETLAFMLKRSSEAEDDVLSITSEIIIQPLIGKSLLDPTTVPIVRGLGKFESTKMPKVLAPIATWLAKMYCNYGTTPQRDITNLLAVATKDPANTREALVLEATIASTAQGPGSKLAALPVQVMIALENKQLSQNESLREQYIGHLQIIANISVIGEQTAGVFEEKGLHRTLMKALLVFLGISGSLSQQTADAGGLRSSVDLMRLKILDLRTCAALFDGLTALMLQSQTILQELVNARPPEVSIVELLVIAPTATPAADPVLLAASLRGLIVIFKTFSFDNLPIRSQVMENIVQILKQTVPLLDYIDSNNRKYHNLYFLAEQHLAEKRETQSKSNIAAAPTFSGLQNPLMYEAFAAIVNVLEYFTSEGKVDKLCAEVSEALNDKERERLLFKLLEVPSSDVKDAVMSCVRQVNMVEMSGEEAGFLVSLCATVKDVTTERSLLEKVIGVLQTLVGDFHGRGAGTSLRSEHGEFLITSVAKVLAMNAKVNTYGALEEEEAKLALSQACVSMMFTASKVPELRVHMRKSNVTSCVMTCLKCEDKYKSASGDSMIERTWAGRSIETLLACLAGQERITPIGTVALRVILRIADVLEGRSDKGMSEEDDDFNKFDSYKTETAMWDLAQMRNDLRSLSDEEVDDREVQQQIFSSFSGLAQVLQFLDGSMSADQRAAMRTAEVTVGQTSLGFVRTAHAHSGLALPASSSGLHLGNADGQDPLALADATLPRAQPPAPRPQMSMAGKEFHPGAPKWVDLKLPPYSFREPFGGAMTIAFAALWELPFNPGGSWVIDFGNGSPDNNVVISTPGQSATLLFNIYRGSGGEVSSLVVPDGALPGNSLSRYLFTVSSEGHMRVFRDGRMLAEKVDGLAPRALVRRRLFVGKSHWNLKEGSFRGQISSLRVWTGVALDWDVVAALPDVGDEKEGGDSNDEDDDDGNDQAQLAVKRQLLMRSLCKETMNRPKVVKQKLLGGIGLRIPTSMPEHHINEALSLRTGDAERINSAYMVSGVLRSAFATIALPASAEIRTAMKHTLLDGFAIPKLLSLVRLSGPFDCNNAAKFFRLLNFALDQIPNSLQREPRIVSTFFALATFLESLCASTISAVAQTIDSELSKRGRLLGLELVTFLSICCRSIPLYVDPEADARVRNAFIESCLDRLLSHALVSFIIEMVLHEPQSSLVRQGGSDAHITSSLASDIQAHNALASFGRFTLAQLLEKCPERKHGVLELFAVKMTNATMPMRRSLLTGLLRETCVRKEMDVIDSVLNGVDGPAPPKPQAALSDSTSSKDIEKCMFFAEVDVYVDGSLLSVSDPGRPPRSFVIVVTGLHYFIIDATHNAYPKSLLIKEARSLVDITRLVRAHVPQMLHIGFAETTSRAEEYAERFLTVICHRESARDPLLSLLHRGSQPLGGGPVNRALFQVDDAIWRATDALLEGDVSLASFGRDSRSNPALFVLVRSATGDITFCSLTLDLSSWAPASPDDADSEAEQDNEIAGLEAGCVVASRRNKGGESAILAVRSALATADSAKGGGGGADIVSSERCRIHTKTANAQREASTGWSWGSKATLLALSSQPRGLDTLEKVAFLPDTMPKMLLGFSGGDQVTIEFYDDMTREDWRTRLMSHIAQQESKSWKRYNNAR
eukprot:TRINITY_DN28935_c0_g1_i1.p1 TRINITY_DN28935_c0_g1~~TRINITY_DN28935_c0_g1_i1.p1  ORF type:complete len:2043 (-),score=242.23 TRINITY_DN28935_c0_g1_i1:78-6206(-)